VRPLLRPKAEATRGCREFRHRCERDVRWMVSRHAEPYIDGVASKPHTKRDSLVSSSSSFSSSSPPQLSTWWLFQRRSACTRPLCLVLSMSVEHSPERTGRSVIGCSLQARWRRGELLFPV
jgi:hypothetical protein